MSEISFPVEDLLRRKFQTGLTVASLTLGVASTVYLLLLGERIGVSIFRATEDVLTSGLRVTFSHFISFAGLLTIVGAGVMVAYTIFVMMSQRVRDIGLMKAVGCPNDLVFGYFATELLIIAFSSSLLGVVIGVLANHSSVVLFSSLGFPIPQNPINFWLILLIFILFFTLIVVLGAKPVLDASKVEPAKAISPVNYFSLSIEPRFKAISRSSLTTKIAFRSLSRKKSATTKIILCLSIVLTLVTVSISGGVIADRTTKSWIEKAVGREIIVIAHQDMCGQYERLLSQFHSVVETSQFNYTQEEYQIPDDLLTSLEEIKDVSIDARLILKSQVWEIPGEIFDSETATIASIGDHRQGESLIVGVEPSRTVSEWFIDGMFLSPEEPREAVLGDSLAHKIFSVPLNQSIRFFGRTFDVVGVCFDPINNGNVTYVPLKRLQNVTGILHTNIVLLRVGSSDYGNIVDQIKVFVESVDPDFAVLELSELLESSLSFVGHIWSSLRLLPLFSVVAASLCLIGYMMLLLAEQRRELGVMRALGIKAATVWKIIAEQGLIILFSSYVAAIPIGVILTLLILVPEPVVTSYMILEIAAWLIIAVIVLFTASMYPAIRLGKKPIAEVMNES